MSGPSTTCDCGRPCDNPDLGCDECRFLDGHNAGDAEVIGAFRLLGGKATQVEIAELTGFNRKSISRIVSRLRKAGRAREVGTEFEIVEVKGGASWTGTQSIAHVYFELRSL